MKNRHYYHKLTQQAVKKHKSVRQWCKAAGVDQSTYYRHMSLQCHMRPATLAKLEAAAGGEVQP